MTRFAIPPRNLVLVGDALARLQQLPDASIDCVVTSPPYFGLRDYQVVGQIGLEDGVEQWVANLAAILRELRRVLTPTGTIWLNLGDSYSIRQREGAPRKSLLLGPERLALRLKDEGWLVRNKVVWAKTNTLPSSVTDRLSNKWEYVFLLAKNPLYFFDLDAIREPHTSHQKPLKRRPKSMPKRWHGPHTDTTTGLDKLKLAGLAGHPLGKNPGDVWRIATTGYRARNGTHHATFPLALADRLIRAGVPEARCSRCRTPWRRPLIRINNATARRRALEPNCDCGAATEPGLVLDPFIGSGTTAVAAEALGRDWLGIELNPSFAALAQQRVTDARITPEPLHRSTPARKDTS